MKASGIVFSGNQDESNHELASEHIGKSAGKSKSKIIMGIKFNINIIVACCMSHFNIMLCMSVVPLYLAIILHGILLQFGGVVANC